jgi:uncharacterized protein YodC (DUF2158 family)
MFQQYQWVVHLQRDQWMRVSRDQLARDQGQVWCEWMARGYHLEAHHETELTPLDRARWPAEL